jgi:hypothetical protein
LPRLPSRHDGSPFFSGSSQTITTGKPEYGRIIWIRAILSVQGARF